VLVEVIWVCFGYDCIEVVVICCLVWCCFVEEVEVGLGVVVDCQVVVFVGF